MRTTLIVQRTINDSARRKRNVVVTGLPASTDGDDRSSFLTFCEERLPVIPALSDNCCIRLGTKQTGRHRRLLVKLSSDEVTSSILRAASSLRRSTDPYVAGNIFINVDMSPAAAQLAFEARKARRAATERRSNTNNTNNTNNAATITAVSDQSNSGVKESSSTPGSLDNGRITNTNQTNSTADPPSLASTSPSSSPF